MTNVTPQEGGGGQAAFLLVIPGCTAIGVGVGLFLSHVIAGTVTGVGAGFLLWGLIVALGRSAPST
jgi:hypothetical protein